MQNNYYLELEKRVTKITQLRNILVVAQWDFSTYLPYNAAESKGKEIAALSSFISILETEDEIELLINKSFQKSEYLDKWQLQNLNLIAKTYRHGKAIDQSLQREYIEASTKCEFIWREARLKNDFKKLEPYLDNVFNIIREIASIKSEKFNIPKYGILLDQFDPDRKEGELNKIFQHTKKHLPALISQILEKQKDYKIIPLSKSIDVKTQEKISTRIAETIGFDFKKGRIDQSVHPFSTGRNDDVRITTKYDEVNILDNIYSVLHEAGHGLYLQNLPSKYKNQPVGDFQGMAFHESQSLFMEKQIGINKYFLEFLSKLLHDEFDIRGNEYSAENLYNLKTLVKPSLIRIEADEVTYPMHVIIRYEIERAIINNEICARDLPKLWKEKTQEYLGITPDSDKNGCMQDIHWVSGLFGYFSTYYTGSIISSMLANNMKNKGLDINTAIKNNDFCSINSFLNKNLRYHGSGVNGNKLLELSTGSSEISTDIFFNYLKEKYLDG